MRKLFINKTDAKKWATAVERKLDTGDYSNYEEASKILLVEFFFWSIGAFVIGLVLIKITEILNGERIGSLPNIFPFKYIFKIDKKDEHN